MSSFSVVFISSVFSWNPPKTTLNEWRKRSFQWKENHYLHQLVRMILKGCFIPGLNVEFRCDWEIETIQGLDCLNRSPGRSKCMDNFCSLLSKYLICALVAMNLVYIFYRKNKTLYAYTVEMLSYNDKYCCFLLFTRKILLTFTSVMFNIYYNFEIFTAKLLLA